MAKPENRTFTDALKEALADTNRRDLPTLLLCSLVFFVSLVLQGAVSIQLLPTVALQGNTGGVGFALAGLVIELFVVVFVFKLALAALHHHAGITLRSFDAEHAFASDRKAVAQALVISGLGLPVYLALLHGHAAIAILLFLVLLTALPGAILGQALDGGWIPSFGLPRWVRQSIQMGYGYFHAMALVATMILGAFVLGGLSADYPLLLGTTVFLAVSFSVVAFYAFVGVILRGGARMAVADPIPCSPEEKDSLLDANALARAGKTLEALSHLQVLVRRGASDAIHDRYGELVAHTGRSDLIAEYFPGRICSLLALEKTNEALSLLDRAIALDPAFTLKTPDEVFLLTAKAMETARFGLAYNLSASFMRNFPRHDRYVDVAVTNARLEVERYGRMEEGLKILDEVLQRCDRHPLRHEIWNLANEWRGISKLPA